MRVLFLLSTTQYRWLAVLWTLAIVGGLSLPASSLSPVSAALSADKLIHAGLFLVFGVLWMGSLCPPHGEDLRHRLPRTALLLFVVGGGFAVGTEVYQHFLPVRRMADPYDALADGIGLVLGILLYTLLLYRAAPASPPSAREHSQTNP